MFDVSIFLSTNRSLIKDKNENLEDQKLKQMEET